jgi:ribosomal protein S21
MQENKKSDKYLETFHPIEVLVTGRIEDAIGRFRSMVTKERIMSDLKEHAAYEKPSAKKRRKSREAQARMRKAASIARRNAKQPQVDEFDNLS